jgi:CheY-like chemotaxis protein
MVHPSSFLERKHMSFNRRGPHNSKKAFNVKGRESPEGGGNRPAQESKRLKTILFVDDELSVLTVRRSVFEALGYSVLTASSGSEALDLLQAHAVDAVVLDYTMTPMDGEEMARNIRRAHGNVVIILSSGCLSLPASVLEVVDVSVEKGSGLGALVEALRHFASLSR